MSHISILISIFMSLFAAGYGIFSIGEGAIFTAAGTFTKKRHPIRFYLGVGICFMVALFPLVAIFTSIFEGGS